MTPCAQHFILLRRNADFCFVVKGGRERARARRRWREVKVCVMAAQARRTYELKRSSFCTREVPLTLALPLRVAIVDGVTTQSAATAPSERMVTLTGPRAAARPPLRRAPVRGAHRTAGVPTKEQVDDMLWRVDRGVRATATASTVMARRLAEAEV